MAALVQIRNVPEQTRRRLKQRAAARGESLNTYLLRVLAAEVERPTVADVLDRAASRSERATVSAIDIVRRERSQREGKLSGRSDS
jgi:plasmid stability protein